MSRFDAVFCDHTQMTSCCDPECGHYSCPCGISWDDGFSSPFDEDFLESDACLEAVADLKSEGAQAQGFDSSALR